MAGSPDPPPALTLSLCPRSQLVAGRWAPWLLSLATVATCGPPAQAKPLGRSCVRAFVRVSLCMWPCAERLIDFEKVLCVLCFEGRVSLEGPRLFVGLESSNLWSTES